LVLAVLLMIPVFAFLAFSIDVGYIGLTQSQLQNTADAAAMAGAYRLLDDARLGGSVNVDKAARDQAIRLAGANQVAGIAPLLKSDEDITLGRLISGELVTSGDAKRFNAVKVRVSRAENSANSPLNLIFAPAIGHRTINLKAEATASFPGDVGGFQITAKTGNSTLIPFTVHIDAWRRLIDGTASDGDAYTYNSKPRSVTSGGDGIRELKLWTGDSLAPGNFGTLNIGDPANSNAQIQKQIREGVSSTDANYYGGKIELNPSTGTLQLGGDSGLTTEIARTAEEIIGKPVSLPIYRDVAKSGSKTSYTIVGFAGVRIVHVEATGGNKSIRIQPAYVVDSSAITGTAGASSSQYVYGPVRLTK
jgi:hypothetical protein